MTSELAPPTAERLALPMATGLALILLWWAPDALPMNLQLLLLAVLVVVFGLPHGALDPWLAERAGLAGDARKVVAFNLAYLAVAALVVLVWVWLPVLSLAVFLAISAVHFSGDWKSDLDPFPRLVAGLLLLLMPIGFQTNQVAVLFEHLSGEGGAALAQALALPAWVLVAIMMTLTGVALRRQRWWAGLEFASLLALAYVAQPLVYFALYFCALHSLRHLAGLFRHAPPADQARLWRMTIVYSVATVFLAGVLWVLWSQMPADTLILRLVFIGLAAVTVPHMLLMARVKAMGLQ
jgi:Brp/Blh family beta-carotene 15,15'-monooxygenase